MAESDAEQAGQRAREVLRRMHLDEPVELTNPRAQAASHMLSDINPREASAPTVAAEATIAQVHATLALAQEIKNLRIAMYGEGH